MIVRDHGPEALESNCRHTHSPLRQVALEQRLDELLAPGEAVALGAGEVCQREAATPPECCGAISAHFGQRKASDGDVLSAACQTLRAFPQEIASSTAEDQEVRRPRSSVGQHPEHREEITQPLHFVDDHQTAQRS